MKVDLLGKFILQIYIFQNKILTRLLSLKLNITKFKSLSVYVILIFIVCFLLGNSLASEFYMPTFRNTLSVPSSKAGRCRMTSLRKVGVFIQENVWFENSLSQWLRIFSNQTFSHINTPTFSNPVILHTYPPMKMDQTKCSKMSAYKIQTSGNYPEESIQHSEHSESLKSRIQIFIHF